MRTSSWLKIFLLGFLLMACKKQNNNSANQNRLSSNAVINTSAVSGKVRKESFGKAADGTEAKVFILTNGKGAEAKITDYGATLTSLKMPAADGISEDIVLGFDSVEGYTSDAYSKANPYFGAIIGRYGNRIADAKFSLGGAEYKLAANHGDNNLHGGKKGFDKVFWRGKEFPSANGAAAEFTYLSNEGEEGFPGNLTAKVVYNLTDDNELKIDYTATTDKETIVNLTHHSYFNLAGQGSGDILKHQLKIDADKFTPMDKDSIPTDEIVSVEGTPLDFRNPKEIGENINSDNEQIKFGKGYDHNFVLNGESGKLRVAAVVSEPRSGRVMEVLTTEPGIQLYTGNLLDGSLKGKNNAIYRERTGFCLETQHFPDSPNKTNFPSTVLKPGETYKTQTIYKFSTDKV